MDESNSEIKVKKLIKELENKIIKELRIPNSLKGVRKEFKIFEWLCTERMTWRFSER